MCIQSILNAHGTPCQAGTALWAINGVGLALVIPSGQSLIADYYPPATRGRAFGALYLTGAVGGMLGSLYATNMGAPQSPDTSSAPALCRREVLVGEG